MNDYILLSGLRQNNLNNITLHIPKHKIVVFTGVSGSGKSSIVFDTVAAEAARQMNDTYPAFVRSRLPKYTKPACDLMENLSPAVVVDQTPLGANARSTVGTSSEIYSGLRLLFSRIGQPYAGTASFFSFNDPAGMCQQCAGLGLVTDLDLSGIIDPEKSLNQGAIQDSMLRVGSWYWKQYTGCGYFDPDKRLADYSETERNLLYYGAAKPGAAPTNPKIIGLYNLYRKRYLNREESRIHGDQGEKIITQKICPLCGGKRLNRIALSCWINGCSIADLCELEMTDLAFFLDQLRQPSVQLLVDSLQKAVQRMIDIGLGYLNLARPTQTLSGGEAQRVKLVRYLGSSLSDMLYIFDEPSTGMHPRDVYRMNALLQQLRDRGNTVLVVEHDEDVIAIADEVIDVGPLAGAEGGEIVFQGSYAQLLISGTKTGKALSGKKRIPAVQPQPTLFLPIHQATLHNLKGCSARIPLGCICAVTGVAGSGKSSLMQVFASLYPDRVIPVDQKPITATNRSTPASFLGFMDEIRKEFAKANGVDEGYFSFNSLGACPICKGKGEIVTELAFMDPIVTTCEGCCGRRYSAKALSYLYRQKDITQLLSLTAKEAIAFFNNTKIRKKLQAMIEVGLGYLTLGQPLSTLSGGERQRIKLAESLSKKGSIYLLDEPTTGLHPSDMDKLVALFRKLVQKGNSVIVIEHSLEMIKQCDYIIDVGPDGGKNGGEIVFEGTPRQMLEADTVTARCLRISESGQMLTPEEIRQLVSLPTAEKEQDMSGYRLNPIGRAECEQGEYRIVLDKQYLSGLQGLQGFTHLQVIWWFDGCDNTHDRSVLCSDKPYTHGPEKMGSFATRSPQRPNPIAITPAQVLGIDYEAGVIRLAYLDALTGTPILDIKPYTPSLDRIETAATPAWCSHWPDSYEKSEAFDWEKEFNFE